MRKISIITIAGLSITVAACGSDPSVPDESAVVPVAKFSASEITGTEAVAESENGRTFYTPDDPTDPRLVASTAAVNAGLSEVKPLKPGFRRGPSNK